MMAPSSSNSIHFRSTSLPSTSHPSLVQVEECLNLVKGWAEASTLNRRCSSVKAGINHLKDLNLSTIEFLQLPLTQLSLRGQESLVSELMDVFIGLLDVCGMVKDSFSQLREKHQHLSSLVRRRDSGLHESIGVYQIFRKRMRRDMIKCLRSLKSMRISKAAADDDGICGTLVDVIANTISMFEFLIPMISGQKGPQSALLKFGFFYSKRCDKNDDGTSRSEIDRVDATLYAVYGHSSKESREDDIQVAQRQMASLDLYLRETESELEGLFRCLINFRASFLNILTGC